MWGMSATFTIDIRVVSCCIVTRFPRPVVKARNNLAADANLLLTGDTLTQNVGGRTWVVEILLPATRHLIHSFIIIIVPSLFDACRYQTSSLLPPSFLAMNFASTYMQGPNVQRHLLAQEFIRQLTTQVVFVYPTTGSLPLPLIPCGSN